jgi:FkbM family methyltransferase
MNSQNNEAEIVMGYFHGAIGAVLDIGANDGETFSNSYDLIKYGWSADLVEPSPAAFAKLIALYGENYPKIKLHNFAISSTTSIDSVLYDSGAHVAGGQDRALVSTIVETEKSRWPNVEFEAKKCHSFTFKDSRLKGPYDFISIDCEGMDWDILQQMNLSELGCHCICLEHNSDSILKKKMIEYCSGYSLNKVLLQNAENIILAK